MLEDVRTREPQKISTKNLTISCIKYEKGIEWKRISEKFGSPDITPLPEPGTGLGRNIRVYKNKIIIFYTELEEFKEGEKIRFYEVITGVDVCREK